MPIVRAAATVLLVLLCSIARPLHSQTIVLPTLESTTYTSAPSLVDVPVILCIPSNYAWESYDVTMLNSGASASFGYGSGWSVCENPITLLVDITLASGENILQVTACIAVPEGEPVIGDPCLREAATIYFAPSRAAAVRSHVDAGGIRLSPDSATTVAFTLRNVGNFSSPFSVAPTCSGGLVLCRRATTGDSSWTTPVLAVGDSVVYSLEVRASAANVSSGAAGLRATPVNASNSATAFAYVAISNQPRAAPVVARTRDTLRIAVSAAGGQAVFEVKNPDPQNARLISLSASCGNLSGCTIAPSAPTWIAPNESVDVSVTFSSPATSQTTKVVLTATAASPSQASADSMPVRVGGSIPVTLALEAVSPQPGSSVSRHLCQTAYVSDAMMLECGGLVASHATPATRTMNAERRALLTYRSRQAEPRIEVPVVVSYRGSAVPPDSLRARLEVAGVTNASHYRAWRWAPACGTAAGCRIVFPLDAAAAAIPTGVYAYRLIVRSSASEVSPQDTVIGHFAVVDDRHSPFGPGWWLGGLERLVALDSLSNSVMWIGGDGSTRLYVRQGTSSAYLPHETVDRPDTLLKLSSSWLRRLPGGATVSFDSLLRHSATTNPLGQVTSFHYGSLMVPDSISLPVPADTTRTIRFIWSGSPPRLDSVSVVAQASGGPRRRTALERDSLGRVVSIRDPDTTVVRFRYAGTSARLSQRISRAADTTEVVYDALGFVTQVVRTMRGDSSLRSRVCPVESQSLVGDCRDSLAVGPISRHRAFTLVDGPRLDVPDLTRLFPGRFGGADSIIDAHGGRWRARRDDSRFPGLLTETIDARGAQVKVAYNSRGLVDSVTRVAPYGGADATQLFTWHPKWPAPVQVRSASGVTTHLEYDDDYPLILSERVGGHDSTRVYLRYDQHRRLVAVKTPTDTLTHVTRYGYDEILGNLSADSAAGGAWQQYFTDRAGQVNRVQARRSTGVSGPSRAETYAIDVMGRVLNDSIIGSWLEWTVDRSQQDEWSDTTATRRALVRRVLDSEGRVVQITRLVPEDSARKTVLNIEYDAVGRVSREWENSPFLERFFVYDAAGNAVRLRDRNGQWVAQSFDALGRLAARTTPSVGRSVEFCLYCRHQGSRPDTVRVPVFRTRISASESLPGVFVSSETSTFGYDAVGNIILADNSMARVRRSYFLGGGLQADSLRIRDYAFDGSQVTWDHHLAVLSNEYDLDGRRIKRTDSFGGEMRWYFDSTGVLDSIWDRATSGGYTAKVHFRFDAAGRLISQRALGTTRGGSWAYDAAGRPIFHQETGFGNANVLDSTSYDLDGRKLRTMGTTLFGQSGVVVTRMGYDAFGHLAVATTRPPSGVVTSDWFDVDALGYRLRHVKDRWSVDLPDRVNVDSSAYSGERLTRTFATPRPLNLGNAASWSLPYRDTRDTVHILYDQNGAMISRRQVRLARDGAGYVRDVRGSVFEWMLYDADMRLRWSQRTEMRAIGEEGLNGPMPFSTQLDYWYDALGRRVQVHTRTDSEGCSGPTPDDNRACNQSVLRTVWDDAQILREERMMGHYWLPDAALDTGATFTNWQQDSVYGVVRYTHGLGIDAPVVLWRGSPLLVHRNWRGSIAGTSPFQGTASYGGDRYPTAAQNFFLAPDERLSANISNHWYGSLTSELTDGSGLLYRRNRYYDPRSGRFTQPDPIGLAGGLNLYGYAGGDPINFGSARDSRRLG